MRKLLASMLTALILAVPVNTYASSASNLLNNGVSQSAFDDILSGNLSYKQLIQQIVKEIIKEYGLPALSGSYPVGIADDLTNPVNTYIKDIDSTGSYLPKNKDTSVESCLNSAGGEDKDACNSLKNFNYMKYTGDVTKGFSELPLSKVRANEVNDASNIADTSSIDTASENATSARGAVREFNIANVYMTEATSGYSAVIPGRDTLLWI